MDSDSSRKVVLVTGGAKRIGAYLCEYFHAQGCNLVIHYQHSKCEAQQLEVRLNGLRANSAVAIQGAFTTDNDYSQFASKVNAIWGRLDILINNASSFYPTPIGSARLSDAENLLHSNLVMPTFLIQVLAKQLQKNVGCVINILDIYAQSPLKDHMLYCAAKAGLASITKSVAVELAPQVRVNAIAPGNIMWPSACSLNEQEKASLLAKIPLNKQGSPEDIAKAAYFLAFEADYVTGQVLNVDGGKSL